MSDVCSEVGSPPVLYLVQVLFLYISTTMKRGFQQEDRGQRNTWETPPSVVPVTSVHWFSCQRVNLIKENFIRFWIFLHITCHWLFGCMNVDIAFYCELLFWNVCWKCVCVLFYKVWTLQFISWLNIMTHHTEVVSSWTFSFSPWTEM